MGHSQLIWIKSKWCNDHKWFNAIDAFISMIVNWTEEINVNFMGEKAKIHLENGREQQNYVVPDFITKQNY